MGSNLHGFQATIAERFALSGVGVHSGKPVTVEFTPADPDTGINFHHTDADDNVREFRAHASEIGTTDLCTALGDPRGAHVATIEHLMAALSAMRIDNCIVEINASEVPVLDGSAAMFVDAIQSARRVEQAAKRRYIRVTKPVRIEVGASWAEFHPHNGTRFEVEIDFEAPVIGRQKCMIDITPDSFRREVSRARTFGFMKDVERLWAMGFALGASLENTVVIGEDNAIINPEGLRYKDEFVRHKTLDAIGDLALAGAQFIGCFRSYRGGHRLNAAALQALLSDRTAFEIVETVQPAARGRAAELIAVNAPVFAPWTL
jgi:UDP-3-O-[3-hydroxymyristoyl] N-acetylglucosamine deacetylase